jgi:hypothetical protein
MSISVSSSRVSYQRHTPYWLLLLPALAVISLFVIKYQVSELNRQVIQLETDMSQLGDRERVLQTEWTYLNRPEYLQKLNDRFHHLQAPSADQIVDWAEVNSRLSTAQQGASLLTAPANDNAPVGNKPAIALPSPNDAGTMGQDKLAKPGEGTDHGLDKGNVGNHNSPKSGGSKQ